MNRVDPIRPPRTAGELGVDLVLGAPSTDHEISAVPPREGGREADGPVIHQAGVLGEDDLPVSDLDELVRAFVEGVGLPKPVMREAHDFVLVDRELVRRGHVFVESFDVDGLSSRCGLLAAQV